MTEQPKPCRTTQHCAVHGFCHRCTPSLDGATQHLVKAIDAAGITTGTGRVYAALAATVRDAARTAAARQTTGQADTELALRDRIRRAICEAEGFAWDSDMLEPDEYGDHADAVLQALTEHEAATRPDPTTADDPTPLRWGLGDILHSDDDTVTVCLSGPDREPYWLELDAERAAALRDDLAPATRPDTCRPVEVDGTTVLVRGTGDWTAEDQRYMAEVVAAAKRKYEAEHPAVGQLAEAQAAAEARPPRTTWRTESIETDGFETTWTVEDER